MDSRDTFRTIMLPNPLKRPSAPTPDPGARQRFLKLRRKAVNELEQAQDSSDGMPMPTTGNVCLLVTNQLDKAKDRCAAIVDEIIEDCKRKNRKFRDLEFDIEHDLKRCLNGSVGPSVWKLHEPRGLQRVSDLFPKPSFFKDGDNYGNIHQGALGDCWLLSALSTVASRKALVEEFCVKYDASVGVYGFIFFCDNDWVPVIIDDMLFTSLPKWEELSTAEQKAYAFTKSVFLTTMNSGEHLEFAKADNGEQTWVPLIEKAFAKLYGSFRALNYGGDIGEAIETLTGGVNTFIFTKDILDKDRFWTDELMKADEDRLFGCHFSRKLPEGTDKLKVDGLEVFHTYSILKAYEVKGKRFLVIRNPWGQGEWTGPWSDGSKEWTDPDGDEIRKELGHKFGDDGQFVMEYSSFLGVWDVIDRTRLFDRTWTMSSHWLTVSLAPKLSPWTFGDACFTFTVKSKTPAIIVLAQADRRFFQEVLDPEIHTFDFVVFRRGDNKALAFSSHANQRARSVNAELDLEAGSYVVHLRIDRHSSYDRHLARINTEWTRSSSLASNFDKKKHSRFLPVELSKLAGKDFQDLKNGISTPKASSTATFFTSRDGNISASPTATTSALEEDRSPSYHLLMNRPVRESNGTKSPPPGQPTQLPPQRGPVRRQSMLSEALPGTPLGPPPPQLPTRQETTMSNPPGSGKVGSGRPMVQNRYSFHFHAPTNPGEIPLLKSADHLQAALTCVKCMKNVAHEDHKVCVHEEAWDEDAEEDDESRFIGQLTLGLRVYTQNQDGVEIQGDLRRNMRFSYADVLHDG